MDARSRRGAMMAQRLRKAVFPVGGLGTRFLPATKAMPKEMLPIVDKPLIQYAVEEAREAGIDQMIFVTGRGKHAIEDHFDIAFELEATMSGRGKSLHVLDGTLLKPGSIAYCRQQEPMGLGQAGWGARATSWVASRSRCCSPTISWSASPAASSRWSRPMRRSAAI